MERLNSIFYFVILYSIIILASEVDIMESSILHKEKRSYKVKICSKTKLTLVNVTKCPDSDKELLERSGEKHCEILCDGRPCVYHCVKHNDKIVEVCAPVEKIRGQLCPTYDEGIGRVREDFWTVCTKCPFEYYSNDTLKPECKMSTVSISESNKENNTDVITNPNSAVPNCTQVGGRSKRYAECEVSSPTATESSSSTSTRQSEDDKILSGSQEEIYYVIAGVVLFICFVLLSVGMFLHIMRKKAFRETQRKTEGKLICQKKCNPDITSSQKLL